MRCKHCSAEIPFGQEDRGAEVFCPCCGSANLAVVAGPGESGELGAERLAAGPEPKSASAADKPGRPSFFSRERLPELRQRVVSEITCQCGRRVPVRLEDVGGLVECPQCGCKSEARFVPEHPVPRPPVPPRQVRVPVPRPRPIAPWKTIVASAAVLAAIALGAYVTQQDVPNVLEGLSGSVLWRPQAPPLPEVTLAMIERLLEHPDAAEALVHARSWHEALQGRGVAESDRRRVRLKEVIAELERRLTPNVSALPQSLAEFKQLVEGIAKALEANDLAAAHQALDKAEAVLAQHQQELLPYTQRFENLKAMVQELEAKVVRLQRIQGKFREAEQLLQAGQVTKAVESLAYAQFVASGTKLTDAEFKPLNDWARRLIPAVRRAKGKRAVGDALRAFETGDSEAGHYSIRSALAWLAEFPQHEVRSDLDRIEPHREPARRWAETADPKKTTSDLLRKLYRRDRYEKVVELYGQSNLPDLAAEGAEFLWLLDPHDPEQKALHLRTQRLLFDVLRQRVSQNIEALDKESQEDRRLAHLLAIRGALDQVSQWNNYPGWVELDRLVREHGTGIAKRLLDEGRALSEQDKLELAAAKAAQAKGLGDAQVSAAAEALLAKLEPALRSRTEHKASEELWAQIQQLRYQPDRALELIEKIQLYLERFPNGPHAAEVRTLQRQTPVETLLRRMLEEIEALMSRQEWVAARQQTERIAGITMPASLRGKFSDIRQRLEDLRTDAERELAEVLQNHKNLDKEENVLACLERLPRILVHYPRIRGVPEPPERCQAARRGTCREAAS